MNFTQLLLLSFARLRVSRYIFLRFGFCIRLFTRIFHKRYVFLGFSLATGAASTGVAAARACAASRSR
jgi:hypothetical protein